MTPTDRAAALVTRATGKPCRWPVVRLGRVGNVSWLYLYDGLDLVLISGPREPVERSRYAMVLADYRNCRDELEALGVLEAAVKVLDVMGGAA